MGRLVEISGRAELRGPDDAGAQPTRAVHRRVALPDHQLGRQVVQQVTVSRPKRALLGGADRRDLIDDPRALRGVEDIARGRRIEHAQRDVRAIADVAEELQHTVGGVQFHHRGLDVDDVGARLLRMPRQFQTVLRRQCGRTRLDDDVGIDRPRLLDCDLQQALSLGDGQRPELRDTARAPTASGGPDRRRSNAPASGTRPSRCRRRRLRRTACRASPRSRAVWSGPRPARRSPLP